MSAGLTNAAQTPLTEPILRIATYLAAETAMLRRFAPCDLARGNQIKAQALLELMRHARSLAGRGDPGLRNALEMLRTRLAENQAALTLHLDAARTVNAIIVAAVERDGSDRTYGRAARRSGP